MLYVKKVIKYGSFIFGLLVMIAGVVIWIVECIKFIDYIISDRSLIGYLRMISEKILAEILLFGGFFVAYCSWASNFAKEEEQI